MGVIDGHDVAALRRALVDALAAERPVVLHIHTVKGKGFAPAEEGGLEGMEQWHAAKPGSIVDRKPAPKEPAESPKPKPVPVQESDSPAAIAPEKLEEPPPKPSAARLHGGLRRRARRRGRARQAGDRDHRCDGGGNRTRQARRAASRAVLRRRHRRAGRGAVRLGPRPAGREARLRDLLDLPAARLRPDRPRRLPAGARRRLRDGPRRARRRRRPHPPRRSSTSPTSARSRTWS